MNYENINNLKEIEAILQDFKIRLDGCEYDDEEEFEAELERLFPEEVKKVAKRASELGSMAGSHLYGRILADKAVRLKKEVELSQQFKQLAKQQVIEAAKRGCLGAMEDLGTEAVEKLGSTITEQIAFIKLSGSCDLMKHIEYCNKHLKMNISQGEIEDGIRMSEEIASEMARNAITLKFCNCIFP